MNDPLGEKRGVLRTPLEVAVTCTERDRSFSGTARNFTSRGLFLETDQTLSAGATVELAISLPDGGPPLKAAGRVAHHSRLEEAGPSGIGIQLTEIDSAQRDRLMASIEDFWDECVFSE